MGAPRASESFSKSWTSELDLTVAGPGTWLLVVVAQGNYLDPSPANLHFGSHLSYPQSLSDSWTKQDPKPLLALILSDRQEHSLDLALVPLGYIFTDELHTLSGSPFCFSSPPHLPAPALLWSPRSK